MTEFKRNPVKEVLVSELIQDDIETFLYTCRISNISNAIWTNGMIILVFPAHATEKIVERQFDGNRRSPASHLIDPIPQLPQWYLLQQDQDP